MTIRMFLILLTAIGINLAAFFSIGDRWFAANLPTLELAMVTLEQDSEPRWYRVTTYGENEAVERIELVLQDRAPADGDASIIALDHDTLRALGGDTFAAQDEGGDRVLYHFQNQGLTLGEMKLDASFDGRLLVDKKSLSVAWINLTRVYDPLQPTSGTASTF